MSLIEQFHALVGIDREDMWREEFHRIGKAMGFDYSVLVMLPKPSMKLDEAFICSDYPADWIKTYIETNMVSVDPTVAHCTHRTGPLIWSPDTFVSPEQKQMYEEACGYGIRSGLTLPIHGPKGELGIVCFVNDQQPSKRFARDLAEQLPALSLLRDIAFESGTKFALPAQLIEPSPSLTPKEREHLQWPANS